MPPTLPASSTVAPRELWERLVPELRAIAASLARAFHDVASAEDILGELALRTYDAWLSDWSKAVLEGREERSLLDFVRDRMRDYLREARRKRRRRAELLRRFAPMSGPPLELNPDSNEVGPAAMATGEPDPEQTLAAKELRDSLSRSDPELRALLVLRDAGFSHQEIAAILGKSRSTVTRRLQLVAWTATAALATALLWTLAAPRPAETTEPPAQILPGTTAPLPAARPMPPEVDSDSEDGSETIDEETERPDRRERPSRARGSVGPSELIPGPLHQAPLPPHRMARARACARQGNARGVVELLSGYRLGAEGLSFLIDAYERTGERGPAADRAAERHARFPGRFPRARIEGAHARGPDPNTWRRRDAELLRYERRIEECVALQDVQCVFRADQNGRWGRSDWALRRISDRDALRSVESTAPLSSVQRRRRARECATRGDYGCVTELLDSGPHRQTDLLLLLDAARALGRSTAYQEYCEELERRFPEAAERYTH